MPPIYDISLYLFIVINPVMDAIPFIVKSGPIQGSKGERG